MAAEPTRPPAPSEPRFVVCEDTSITIEWDADAALLYHIQYKEYPQAWAGASAVEVAQGQNKMTAALPNLQPCSTYCIRLVAVRPDGVESDPGPEIVIDTQATNCTPKPKSCCVC